MTKSFAASERAADALQLVSLLQARFAERLTESTDTGFEPVEWLRDDGRHGGGVRLVAAGGGAFDRGSVNVSQVHYDDLPEKKLGSATALSTIIHPAHPRAPSIHMHISWTEMRDGHGYWRVMADLNPAIAIDADRAAFEAMLRDAGAAHFEAAAAQGDRYFFIPALERHRGVAHFYLEAFATDDHAADRALAERVGNQAIDCYIEILSGARDRAIEAGDADEQLAYHTLYLFQVLTLDRGTTSGLLVHDQNDVGILGSLPSHVNGALLRSWRPRMASPQELLLDAISGVLGDGDRVSIDEPQKRALAQAVRRHYQTYPEALDLQASGDVAVPTVDNHR